MNTIFMTHSFEAFESLLPADASDSRFLDTILPTIISAADDIRAAQKIVLDASQSSSAILLEEISRFLIRIPLLIWTFPSSLESLLARINGSIPCYGTPQFNTHKH